MIRRLATLLAVAVSTMALASAGLAAASPEQNTSKVLDHTWQGQERTTWSRPAAVRIALSTRIAPPSQQELAKHTEGPGVSDPHLRVRNTLNHFLTTTWFETWQLSTPPTPAQQQLLRHNLVLNINAGHALVARVAGATDHHVTVVGYRADGAQALVADPGAEGAGGPGWQNVPRTRWLDTTELGRWISDYVS